MSATNGQTRPGPAAAEPQQPVVHELGDTLHKAVRQAVSGLVAARAREIAEQAVEDALTESVVESMRQTAMEEATATAAPAAPEELADRPLRFSTVEAFVRDYVAQIYRREVSARGSDNKRRWCPEWWRHGEAIARFEALWTGFEASRHGDGLEMVEFLEHLDRHMLELFDLEGAFKYCSVENGHRAKLVALPTDSAPPQVCPDGNYEQRASGLWTPAERPARRPVEVEFP